MITRYLALVVLVSCAGPDGLQQAAKPDAPSAAPAVNRDAQIQQEFLGRVAKYVEQRKSEEGTLTPLSDRAEPEAMAAHQGALLRAMQRARRGAKAGDLLTPPTRALIRRRLSGGVARPGTASRSAIQDDDPGPIKIGVNGPYPTSVPLTTVPPQVLAALPRLPDEQIEFRFLGTRLILLDTRANMIVDYMERALPR